MSPEVRQFLANIARRQRARQNRIAFQQNNSEAGRGSYGDFTTYPGEPSPYSYLNRGILGLDKILDGASIP